MINKIYTHSWKFHADEVIGVAVLHWLFWYDIPVIRTRDKNTLFEAKWNNNFAVLDVGGELDFENTNLDHHQKDFDIETFWNYTDFEKTIVNYRYVLYTNIFFRWFNSAFDITFNDEDKNRLCQLFRKVLKYNDSDKNIQKSLLSYVNMDLDSDLKLVMESFFKESWRLKTSIPIETLSHSFEYWNYANNLYVSCKISFFEYFSYRRYATAWLVWSKFGYDYVKSVLLRSWWDDYVTDSRIIYIQKYIDEKIIKNVDNTDNWIFYWSDDWHSYEISSMIGSFNACDISDYDNQLMNFYNAELMVNRLFENEIKKEFDVFLSQDAFYENYVQWSQIQFFDRFIPKIEKILATVDDKETLFHVYPSKTDDGEIHYRIWSISTNWFESRRLLPVEWLERNEFDDFIVDGLIFCHNGRFIAEFETLEQLKKACI